MSNKEAYMYIIRNNNFIKFIFEKVKDKFFITGKNNDGIYKYPCCRVLHSQLNFELDHIRPYCCLNTIDNIPKMLYNGENLTKSKIKEYLNTVSNIIFKNPELCKICTHFYYGPKRQKVSYKLFRINTINLNQHRLFCNLKCNYCNYHNIKKAIAPYSVLPPIENLFKNNHISDNCIFIWGGGESTLLPEFNTMTRLIQDRGYKQVLNTNGTIFSEAWAYVLSRDKRTYFTTSLDSGTRETFFKIKGKDLFDNVWENIKKYQTIAINKYSFNAKYIVSIDNCDKNDLDGFIEKCLQTGVKKILISLEISEFFSHLSKKTIDATIYLKKIALGNRILCKYYVPWGIGQFDTIDELKVNRIN